MRFINLNKVWIMKFLTVKQIMKMTGLSRTTIWRLERDEEFPKRRQLGLRRIGWIESEVLDWMESRAQVGSCEGGVAA
jgi:prophage regulatory protein